MSHSPVGKPVAIVGNWQVLLAPVANWLGRRSNAMTDDFVDRLARRAGIKKVVHYTYRIPAYQNAKPEYAAVNLPRPFKQQIPRARCLLATARWREAAGGHIADDVSALFAMVFALLFGRGNGSGRHVSEKLVGTCLAPCLRRDQPCQHYKTSGLRSFLTFATKQPPMSSGTAAAGSAERRSSLS